MDDMLKHYANIFALTPLGLWVMDFTDLVRAVDELKAKGVTDFEAYFAENMHELWGMSAKSKILNVNEYSIKMFGCSSREDFFSSLDKFFIPESLPIFARQIVGISRGERLFQSEGPMLLATGRRSYMMFGTVLFSDVTADQVLGFSWQIDITERKETEQALARSNQELEQFAYVASHDLQEPLRMITSYAQLLERRYGNDFDDRAKKYMNYVITGAGRMKALIGDLLSLSRLKAAPRSHKPVDLSSVLKEVLQSLEVLVKENDANIVCKDSLPMVLGDEARLNQLFQNLISNAIKFRGPNAPKIEISARQDGSQWVISLADNGIGIDKAHQTKIFEPFRRLHSATEYPGTGIGLAVVKKILTQHSGEIWIESEPGQGTTFHFSLKDQSQAQPVPS